MAFSLNTFNAPPVGAKVPTARELRAAAARMYMEPRDHRVRLMNEIGEPLGVPAGGWSGGQSRLMQNGDVRVVWLLRQLSRPSTAEAVSRNLARAVQFVNAEVMLTLVTASRESSSSIAATSGNVIDTFGQGGLDFLGGEYHNLGLPRSVTASWASRARIRNAESGNFIQPANIPARDQVLAYAAQMNASFDRNFVRILRTILGTAASDTLGKATRAALLVWKAFSFLSPAGNAFDSRKSLGVQLNMRFGVRTCLEYLHSKVDQSLPLDLLLSHRPLNRSERIQIAKARVAEALFLERALSTTRNLMEPSF